MPCLLVEFTCENCGRQGIAPATLVSEMSTYHHHNDYYSVERCAHCKLGPITSPGESKVIAILENSTTPLTEAIATQTKYGITYVRAVAKKLHDDGVVKRRHKARGTGRAFVYWVDNDDP